MTNTLFAGIPIDGGGTRPLEADLYTADGQAVDGENIASTGNLNVGNVMNYDAHAQRHMTGGNAWLEGQTAGDDSARRGGASSYAADHSAPGVSASQAAGDPAAAGQSYGYNNYANSYFANTAVPAQEAAENTLSSLSSPSPGSSNGSSSSSHSNSSSSSVTDGTTNYYTTTITETYQYNNSSQTIYNDNDHSVTIGSMVINGQGGNGPTTINTINQINQGNVITSHTVNTLINGGDIISTVNSTLNQIIHNNGGGAGGASPSIGDVTGPVTTIVGELASLASTVVTDVTGILTTVLSHGVDTNGGGDDCHHLPLLTADVAVLDHMLSLPASHGDSIIDVNLSLLNQHTNIAPDNGIINVDLALLSPQNGVAVTTGGLLAPIIVPLPDAPNAPHLSASTAAASPVAGGTVVATAEGLLSPVSGTADATVHGATSAAEGVVGAVQSWSAPVAESVSAPVASIVTAVQNDLGPNIAGVHHAVDGLSPIITSTLNDVHSTLGAVDAAASSTIGSGVSQLLSSLTQSSDIAHGIVSSAETTLSPQLSLTPIAPLVSELSPVLQSVAATSDSSHASSSMQDPNAILAALTHATTGGGALPVDGGNLFHGSNDHGVSSTTTDIAHGSHPVADILHHLPVHL